MCYPISSACQENLMARTIRSATIARSLHTASTWATHGNSNRLLDPQLDPLGKRACCIQDILDEQKRWESIRDRQEPLTAWMLVYLHLQATANETSLASAMADWSTLGYSKGHRKGEWAQEQQNLLHYSKAAHDGTAKAFWANDFTFQDTQHRHLPTNIATFLKHPPKSVRIRWRWQKNGDNGQQITFSQNPNLSYLCPVSAAVRIFNRAQLLQLSATTPLAMYKTKQGITHAITDREINDCF